jgi:hypothetical protein
MFIPKRAVCLSSSIAHYERWFSMRATLLPHLLLPSHANIYHAMQRTARRCDD